MRRHNATGRSRYGPRHIRLYHALMKSAAWRDLDCYARALYLELGFRYNGSNNGNILFSVRQAATALNVSNATAARAFQSLQHHGFIAAETRGGFNVKDKKRQCTEWRLTEYATEGKGPTRDFERWSAGSLATAPYGGALARPPSANPSIFADTGKLYSVSQVTPKLPQFNEQLEDQEGGKRGERLSGDTGTSLRRHVTSLGRYREMKNRGHAEP